MGLDADEEDSIIPQLPSTSLNPIFSANDDALSSPPRKKQKYRYKPRKYTKTNDTTVLEAESLLKDLADGALDVPQLEGEAEPVLKRKRSSRNSVAHYSFSARGNAMDPNRQKPPADCRKGKK